MRPIHPPIRLRPRHQLTRVQEALTDTRVVLIAGARQVGKSTLATMALVGRRDAIALNLDDDVIRRSAVNDPAGLIQHDGVLWIDEIQRVPELLLAIKSAVDRDPRPGRFLLTGSANILSIPQVADALPGRIELVDLWPFSQSEIEGGAIEQFVDRAFAGWTGPRVESDVDRHQYLERAVVGGFPEVVARADVRRRSAWFESYTRILVERDLRQISALGGGEDLDRLLRVVAARSGQLLNVENLSRDAGMAPTTARRYLRLLQAAFLLSVVPAWSNNRTSRVVRAPKLFITDTGLLAHLIRVGPAVLGRPGGDAGPILESFVESEIRKQASWSTERATLHHYRTKDGLEVDLVLESADGRIVGIEVKAAATVRSGDFAGLRHLADRVGERFCCGLVLYTGPHSLPFGDGMWCIPISALWRSGLARPD